MTPKESKIIGLKFSFLSALYLFIIYEIILLVTETSGDFANGILFFIDEQLNLYTVVIYLTHFLAFTLLGRSAGYKIIINKVAPIKIGIFYALLTTILVLIMPVVQLVEIWNFKGLYVVAERKSMIQSFFQMLLFTFLCLSAGWLLSVYRINKKKTS